VRLTFQAQRVGDGRRRIGALIEDSIALTVSEIPASRSSPAETRPIE
jgi:hypothetical protein